jgi:hypothetical protein
MVAPRLSVAQNESPETEFDRTVASAEASLRAGELQLAESRYQTALLQGWMLLAIAAVGETSHPDRWRLDRAVTRRMVSIHDVVATGQSS